MRLWVKRPGSRWRAQLIFLGRFARPYQIPQRFVLRIWQPHRRQLLGATIPFQFQRIPAIGLHALRLSPAPT